MWNQEMQTRWKPMAECQDQNWACHREDDSHFHGQNDLWPASRAHIWPAMGRELPELQAPIGPILLVGAQLLAQLRSRTKNTFLQQFVRSRKAFQALQDQVTRLKPLAFWAKPPWVVLTPELRLGRECCVFCFGQGTSIVDIRSLCQSWHLQVHHIQCFFLSSTILSRYSFGDKPGPATQYLARVQEQNYDGALLDCTQDTKWTTDWLLQCSETPPAFGGCRPEGLRHPIFFSKFRRREWIGLLPRTIL